jgi:methylmalonyl-CoA/ethylmalonyl-CoA epimerase
VLTEGVDHIGIAVRDIVKSLQFYKDVLNLSCSKTEHIPERNIKIALINAGNVTIELVEPVGPGNMAYNYLKEGEEGIIYHLAFKVGDMVTSLDYLRKKEVRLIDGQPAKGASGRKIILFDPKTTYSGLIEVIE